MQSSKSDKELKQLIDCFKYMNLNQLQEHTGLSTSKSSQKKINKAKKRRNQEKKWKEIISEIFYNRRGTYRPIKAKQPKESEKDMELKLIVRSQIMHQPRIQDMYYTSPGFQMDSLFAERGPIEQQLSLVVVGETQDMPDQDQEN